MTARVSVRPSGHVFCVEGHDSLLQAGLRAGLKLHYGCGNGSCGLCKVRVVSGQVVRNQPCDYPLSQAEKAQGYTLLCAHTAASSELTLELLEASGPQDMPQQQLAATVRAIKPLAANTLLLQLQTPRSQRLRFLAGQSVTLGLALNTGEEVQMQYPVASCPCDERNLYFFIARHPDDALAEALFAGAVQPGQCLTVRGPLGDFVLADSPRPLVFAACDLGMAPVKSLIEHALAQEGAQALSLYWLALRQDGHFLDNQCRAWSQALENFEYELLRANDLAQGTAATARAMRADLFEVECDFYLAGPAPFVAALQADLRSAGVPLSHIYRHMLEEPQGALA